MRTMSRSLFVLIITELRGCCISITLHFLSRVAIVDDAGEFFTQPLVMDRATFSGSEYNWAFGTNHALPSCDSSSKRSKRTDMTRPSFSIRSCTAWVARASCLSSFLLACFILQKSMRTLNHWAMQRGQQSPKLCVIGRWLGSSPGPWVGKLATMKVTVKGTYHTASCSYT